MTEHASTDGGHRRAGCLVVGIGNDLRRDDAVGHVVVRAVARRAPGIDTLHVHQVLPELATTLTGRRTVVFVDASVATGPAGVGVTVRRVDPDRWGAGPGHVGSPALVVALAEALDGCAPQAWIVTLPVTDLGFGHGLAPETAGLVPDAVAAILDILRSSV